MENSSAKSPDDPVIDTNTPEARSKRIAASLKKMRREKAGVSENSGHPTRRRRPGESVPARNQRIIDRYQELLALQKGYPRGIPTQLKAEFEISRQYITDKVIKPFLERGKAVNRK